jgi:hypothetical protein
MGKTTPKEYRKLAVIISVSPAAIAETPRSGAWGSLS